jgi:hypothetical protein
MTCNRCGRAQPPDADGPFCAHCGQFLIPTQWVASSPDERPGPVEHVGPKRGYTGPPAYDEMPTWGYPAKAWQPPADESEPASTRRRDPVDPVRRIQLQAGLLVPLLRGLAVLAGLAAVGEVWRFVLLLASRDEALAPGAVAGSDALVTAAAWVSTAASVGVGAYLIRWVLRVYETAAASAGVRPPRLRWTIVLGWVLPGLNLSVPGSVLTETEHMALGRPVGRRPNPSPLLRAWWLVWAGNVLLGVATVLWGLRTGVQAQADGVQLHVLVDLVVAATAVLTARVVVWLTALVSPPVVGVRPVVVRIGEPARTR